MATVDLEIADIDAKDEDIDIGEDVPETFAPVVIGKDTGGVSSPSSSSSSDSSSSSGLYLCIYNLLFYNWSKSIRTNSL